MIHRQTLGDSSIQEHQNYLKFGNYFNPGFIEWMKETGLNHWDIYYDRIKVARTYGQLGL